MPSFTHLTAEKANQMTPEWSFRGSWPTINQYVTSAFSYIYQYAINALPKIEEKPFFLKAQEETHFQHYLGWCNEVKKVEHWLLMQLEEKSIHPIAFRKALLVPQKKFRTSIVSPVYYQQRLEVLEQKILKLALPTLFRDAVSEARVRFKEILQANPEAALHYFYDDVINQLIQLSGRQLLPRTLLDALGYYQDLVPEKMYQSTMTLLEQFIDAHQKELTMIDDLYLEHCVSNEVYKTLLTAINAVFMTEMMPIKPFEKSEVEAPQTLKITPRFVALTTVAVSAGALISYGLLNSNINFQNAWTWIQDSLEQTAKHVWTNVNVTPMWSAVTQATLSYGVFYQASSLNPGIWSRAVALSALFSMSAAQFPAQFDLADLNGANGFSIKGLDNSDYPGSSISSGDINGDGIADLLIGAPFANFGAGQSYVVFGSRSPFPASFDLANLNGINGFVVNNNYNNDGVGGSISSGDINGDGIADLLIGGGSRRYVVYGARNSFPANLNLVNLNGANGFRVDGIFYIPRSGAPVSSGDINGDGITDLLIGAPAATQSYVVFGSKYIFPPRFDVTSLNGDNGFRINGNYSNDGSSASISSGDINGDGIADLLIGGGQISVIYGSKDLFPASFNLTSLNGDNGFSFRTNYDYSASISSGDINGDGIADLLIGNRFANFGNEQSYVVFGSKYPFPASFDLTNLNGANGFRINGNYGSGGSISSGDINGDGIADFLIGAYLRSYVVYGSKHLFPASFNLTSLDGNNGFVVVDSTNDHGYSVSIGSGDINGDGIADLLIGASGGGRSYVIFGSSSSNKTGNTGTGLIIITVIASSLALIACISGIAAFWVYQKRKNRSLSPELQPLLGTADFRDYDTLELSNSQTNAANLEQEQREALQIEQENDVQIIAEQTLSADAKLHDQPKEPGSMQSNPSSMKLYQTSVVKQTFFYAGAKAEQKNELLNIDSPSDAPSHVASSNNLKQQFSLNLKS